MNKIKVLSANCNGIKNKINELLDTIIDTDPDIILLQETKLDSNDKFILKIKGYHDPIDHRRTNKQRWRTLNICQKNRNIFIIHQHQYQL